MLSVSELHKCSPATHPGIPVVGDELLYVADCYGSPIPVTVTAVDMGDIQDLNVWRWRRDDAGQALPVIGEDGRPVLVDWPNPNIELVAADGRTFMTRQIRYRGSPGWTWPLYLAREA